MMLAFFRRRALLRGKHGRTVRTEAGALLAGTSLLRAARTRAAAAPWMAVNLVAHGDLAQIGRWATRSRLPRHVDPDILRASRQIAQEVVAIVGGDEELLALLQRMLLVPLELDLLAASAREELTVQSVLDAAHGLLGVRRH